MLSRADSVGVFQVESRAQMSMLPRLKPACFYDLVIEVAIVRPGPIQGDMVHPYLRRRDGLEPCPFPQRNWKAFRQDARGAFVSGTGDADRHRRRRIHAGRGRQTTARHGHLPPRWHHPHFPREIHHGMRARGYEADFAERCFSQIEGFGEYGFPESHAASFALLVYVSSWIKCFYPEVFCAALINSQPMGFYQPAQLVRDAREHGVEIRPPDVNASDWDCTLEPAAQGGGAETQGRCAVRLGLRIVTGLPEIATRNTVLAKRGDGYCDIPGLWRRSGAPAGLLEQLADAGCLPVAGARPARGALGHPRSRRRHAAGGTQRSGQPRAPIFAREETGDLFQDAGVALPRTTLGEHVVEDYSALGLSLKAHPVSFFRENLRRQGIITSAEHWGRAARRAAGDGGRPGARAPTARHGERRHLPHARGRDGCHQRGRMAEDVRALPTHRHGGPFPGRPWSYRATGPRDPRHCREPYRFDAAVVSSTQWRLSDGSDHQEVASPRTVREGSWTNRSRDFH